MTTRQENTFPDLFAEVNALAIALKRFLAALHAGDGLPPGGRAVLGTLSASGERTVPSIAQSHACSRQNIQVLVDRLSEMGLVSLLPNPAHKRSSLVHITEKGKHLLARAAAREISSIDALSNLPETAVGEAAVTLRQIRSVLETTREKRAPKAGDSRLEAGPPFAPVEQPPAPPFSPPAELEEMPVSLL
jgi:DNA-binding MarR family transcriptional regulator